jgi:hypothetical protein
LQYIVAAPFRSVTLGEIRRGVDKCAAISDMIRRFSKFDPEPKEATGARPLLRK